MRYAEHVPPLSRFSCRAVRQNRWACKNFPFLWYSMTLFFLKINADLAKLTILTVDQEVSLFVHSLKVIPIMELIPVCDVHLIE